MRGEREGRWRRTERTIPTDGTTAAKREEGRDEVEAKPSENHFHTLAEEPLVLSLCGSKKYQGGKIIVSDGSRM